MDFPDPGVEPASPILAGRFFITELLGKSIHKTYTRIKLKNILQSFFCTLKVRLKLEISGKEIITACLLANSDQKEKREKKLLGCISVEASGHSQRRVIKQDRTFQAPHLLLCEALTCIPHSPGKSPTTLGIQALVGTPHSDPDRQNLVHRAQVPRGHSQRGTVTRQINRTCNVFMEVATYTEFTQIHNMLAQ